MAPKIAIVTLYTPEIAHYAIDSTTNKTHYAKRHGLDIIVCRERLCSRSAAWSKIYAVLTVMKKWSQYDYVVWMDADAIFLDGGREGFEEIVEITKGEGPLFYACLDSGPLNAAVDGAEGYCGEYFRDLYGRLRGTLPAYKIINTGVFIVRNCPAAVALLDKVLTTITPTNASPRGYSLFPAEYSADISSAEWPHEQGPISEVLYQSDPALYRILPSSYFNVTPEYRAYGQPRRFREEVHGGAFVFHYTGFGECEEQRNFFERHSHSSLLCDEDFRTIEIFFREPVAEGLRMVYEPSVYLFQQYKVIENTLAAYHYLQGAASACNTVRGPLEVDILMAHTIKAIERGDYGAARGSLRALRGVEGENPAAKAFVAEIDIDTIASLATGPDRGGSAPIPPSSSPVSSTASPSSAPTVIFVTGGYWEAWGPGTAPRSGSIGGSEYMLRAQAQYVASKGYNVHVFVQREMGPLVIENGVAWHSNRDFKAFVDSGTPIDHCIISRHSIFLSAVNGRKNVRNVYLWLHDVLPFGAPICSKDNFRAFWVLSPWHREYVHGQINVPYDLLRILPNGITAPPADLSAILPKKIPKRFLYSSSVERGLVLLLQMMPRFREVWPDVTLSVCCDIAPWKGPETVYTEEELKTQYRIRTLLEEQREYVTLRGRLQREELYREFEAADYWIYPSIFAETFCISALEAQWFGAIPVCSNLAALSTTVGDRGVVIPIKGDRLDVDDFVTTTVRLINTLEGDTQLKQAMREKGKRFAEGHTIEKVGDQLLGLLLHNDLHPPTVPEYHVIDNFLSREECMQLLNAAGDYHPAPVGEGPVDEAVRKAERAFVDDPGFAASVLLPKVRGKLPTAKAVNPRLRIIRYEVGGFFAPHYDGKYREGEMESRWTLQVYLADLCEGQGGGTRFVRYDGEDVVVQPKMGRALLFDQELLHAGDPVKAGPDVKIVMRTDVF